MSPPATNNLKITHTQSRQIRRPERLCGICLAAEVDSTQTIPRGGLPSRGHHTTMGTRRCDFAALLCASCRLHKLGLRQSSRRPQIQSLHGSQSGNLLRRVVRNARPISVGLACNAALLSVVWWYRQAVPTNGGIARQRHNLPGAQATTLLTRRYHQPSAQADM